VITFTECGILCSGSLNDRTINARHRRRGADCGRLNGRSSPLLVSVRGVLIEFGKFLENNLLDLLDFDFKSILKHDFDFDLKSF